MQRKGVIRFMSAFVQAFEAMKGRPRAFLGIALMYFVSMFLFGILAVVLMVVTGFGLLAGLGSQIQSFQTLGVSPGEIVGLVLQNLGNFVIAGVIWLVAFMFAGAFMAAGAMGSAATAIADGVLTGSVERYLASAVRYFWPILLVSVLFALGAIGYWLIVLGIAWILHGVMILAGLWLFLTLLAFALLYMPIGSLAMVSIVLGHHGAAAAYGEAIRLVRQRPLPVMGILLGSGLIELLILLVTSAIFNRFGLAGSLINSFVISCVTLYTNLVWLYFYDGSASSRSVANPPAVPG